MFNFQQHFYQGLTLHESEFLQLPGIEDSNLAHFSRKFKKSSFKDVVQKPQCRKRLLEYFGEDSKTLRQVELALECIPNNQLSMRSFVKITEEEFQEEIFQGDIFTVEFTLKRLNKRNGFIHSKAFPFLKKESLNVLVFYKNPRQVVHFEKIIIGDREDKKQGVVDGVFQRKIEFSSYAQFMGVMEFELFVISDSYIGLDECVEFEVKVGEK